MATFKELKAQVVEMGDELIADPNTPPNVRAYLYMVKAIELLETPMSAVQRPEQEPTPRATSVHFTPKAHVDITPMGRGRGIVRRKVDPNRLAILKEAETVLEVFGPRMMTTAEIFDAMGEIRESLGGKDKRGNLSAMLHHSPTFRSHGRRGWTLAKDDPPATAAPVVDVADDVQQKREAHTFSA